LWFAQIYGGGCNVSLAALLARLPGDHSKSTMHVPRNGLAMVA